ALRMFCKQPLGQRSRSRCFAGGSSQHTYRTAPFEWLALCRNEPRQVKVFVSIELEIQISVGENPEICRLPTHPEMMRLRKFRWSINATAETQGTATDLPFRLSTLPADRSQCDLSHEYRGRNTDLPFSMH